MLFENIFDKKIYIIYAHREVPPVFRKRSQRVANDVESALSSSVFKYVRYLFLDNETRRVDEYKQKLLAEADVVILNTSFFPDETVQKIIAVCNEVHITAGNDFRWGKPLITFELPDILPGLDSSDDVDLDISSNLVTRIFAYEQYHGYYFLRTDI